MFEFANIMLLLLLPLPIIIWCVMPRAVVKPGNALIVPFYQRIQQISHHRHSRRIWAYCWHGFIAWLVWILLVIALAGPQWLSKPVSIVRAGRNIMLAIDISGSMQTPDMVVDGRTYDRLTIVKAVADHFIKQRVGDRLGLILFGSKAYLQTPLTYDHKTVATQLNDATIGLAGQRTAMGDAIGLAIKHLSKQQDSRVLIVLTDGETNAGVDPIQATELAAKHHIRIYTIGLGAEQVAVQTPFGTQYMRSASDLDVNTLKKVADLTGGTFFRANDSQALATAYHQLNQLEPVTTDETIYRPITPLYPWPLGVALLCSLYLFIRHLYYRIGMSVKLSSKEKAYAASK